MKIILIGASGTLGKAAHAALKERHEIITASRSSGDFRVDINEEESIRRLYQQVGAFDALVSCTGNVHFPGLKTLPAADAALGYVKSVEEAISGQILRMGW